MTAGLRAVLFDLDGLLIDSEPLWTIAETELFASLGDVPWSTAAKRACMGHRLDAAVPIMLAFSGRPDASHDEAAEFLLGRMVQLFHQSLPVRSGVVELLEALADRGVPLGLVSSSYRVLVDAALDVLGAERFAVTVAGDEVAAAKPDPEPYLTAAARLAVPPAGCVVLEDSRAGVSSALAAGMCCVAVPELQVLEPADRLVVVGSLREVDVDVLDRLVAAADQLPMT
ncbi:MAG TPA: HAD family phosphatase [Mycobacteriales bacterium]|nr:HAD family phosphatase [Mycobacteriales bacterium]